MRKKHYPRPWVRDALRAILAKNVRAKDGVLMNPAGLVMDMQKLLKRIEEAR